MNAKVAYVINRKKQDKLESWKVDGAFAPGVNVSQEELPF